MGEYKYAIGTTPGATNVRDWTSAGTQTEITATGLDLAYNAIYYVAVQARNGAGTWSSVGVSNGITVLERRPTISSTQPPNRSRLVQGQTVTIQVTASDPDGDAIQSRFRLGTTIIKEWSAVHSATWTVPATVQGSTNLTIEVRDPTDGLTVKQIPVWILVPPVGPPS